MFTEKDIPKISGIAAGVIFTFAMALSSFTVIDTGEAGVVLRLGKYSGVMAEGLNFKTPFCRQGYKNGHSGKE